VVLPGGIGTMFEAFEILTRKRINTFPIDNPVVFVDLTYYSSIRNFITQACETGFIKVPLEKFAAFANTPKEIIGLIKR
jgi:predicted Rossmann-fold nucleotide-binding protein